jgi:uncharacterized membrane protein YbhN (UPF0104 family)
MKGNHGRRTEIATVMLLDRLFGTFALVSLPLLIAPLFPELLQSMKLLRVLLWSSAAGFIAMSTGIIICFWARATESSLLLRTIEKLPLGEYIKRIYDTICAYRQNLGTLMGVVAISILVHTLLITVMLLLVSVTSADGASREMAVLFPFGFLANSLPITPGGLGVGEIAFGKLFDLAGLTGGVEALLGWRMLTLVIDLLGLFFYLQGRHELLSYQAQPGIPPVLER